MSDTVKLIIEIPKELYENKKGYLTNMDAYIICKAVQNGTPLDDVKADIEASKWTDKDTRVERNALASGLDKAIEILDNIGKAESEDT